MARRKLVLTDRSNTPTLNVAREGAMQSPFFQQLLALARTPGERAEIYNHFDNYLRGLAYDSPLVNRLLHLYSLKDYAKRGIQQGYEPTREDLLRGVYDTPGRKYPYVRALIGPNEKGNVKKPKKRGVIRGLEYAIGSIVREGWPAFAALGGWGVFNNWYGDRAALGVMGRAAENFTRPKWYYSLPILGTQAMVRDTAGAAAKEGVFSLLGAIRMPALYLIGGYAIYKTIKALIKSRKNRRQKKELDQLRYQVAMQNRMLSNTLMPRAA